MLEYMLQDPLENLTKASRQGKEERPTLKVKNVIHI